MNQDIPLSSYIYILKKNYLFFKNLNDRLSPEKNVPASATSDSHIQAGVQTIHSENSGSDSAVASKKSGKDQLLLISLGTNRQTNEHSLLLYLNLYF